MQVPVESVKTANGISATRIIAVSIIQAPQRYVIVPLPTPNSIPKPRFEAIGI
jgi:hypothetical protein